MGSEEIDSFRTSMGARDKKKHNWLAGRGGIDIALCTI